MTEPTESGRGVTLTVWIQLHRHALANSKRGIAVDENGKLDDEVSVISSEQNRKFYGERYTHLSKKFASDGWHAE